MRIAGWRRSCQPFRQVLDHPLTKGIASLVFAGAFVALPALVDAIRARRSAAPIRITASPVSSADSTVAP